MPPRVRRKRKQRTSKIPKVAAPPQETTSGVKLGRKEITQKLTWSAVMHFSKLKKGCFTELGIQKWGHRRADVVCIGLKGGLTICEVKSCRADFQSDTKYTEYLPYCHQFYFVVHNAKIFTDEDVKRFKELGIGILLLTNGYLRAHLKAKKRTIKRREKKEMLYRMAWRSAQFSVRTGVRRYKTTLS